MKNEIKAKVVESLIEQFRSEMAQFLISDKNFPESAEIKLHYESCTQTISIDFSDDFPEKSL